MQISLIELPHLLSVLPKTILKHKSFVSGSLLDNENSETLEVLMSVNNQIYEGLVTFEGNHIMITQGVAMR